MDSIIVLFCNVFSSKTKCHLASWILYWSGSSRVLQSPGALFWGIPLLRLLVKHNALHLPCFSSSLDETFRNIGEFGVKTYFTDHRTANTTHSFRDSVPVPKIPRYYWDMQKLPVNFHFHSSNKRRLQCVEWINEWVINECLK